VNPEDYQKAVEYLATVRRLAQETARYVPIDRLYSANRLIDHGEPAEGVAYLAWAIVQEEVLVPAVLIKRIRECASGIVADRDMPSNFEDFALSEGEDPLHLLE